MPTRAPPPNSCGVDAYASLLPRPRHQQPTEKWDTIESEDESVYKEFENQMTAQQMGTVGRMIYTTLSSELEEKKKDRDERRRIAEFEVSSIKFMEEMRARDSRGLVATWYEAARPVPSGASPAGSCPS